MKKQKYLKNVTTLKMDMSKCIGCSLCTTVCPHSVFKLDNKKSQIIDKDACMECGACALNCPVNAIEVNSGVGCAVAVINKILGKTNSNCCCIDQSNQSCCNKE